MIILLLSDKQSYEQVSYHAVGDSSFLAKQTVLLQEVPAQSSLPQLHGHFIKRGQLLFSWHQ